MVKITVDSLSTDLMESVLDILNEQECYYALNFYKEGFEISTRDLILPIILPCDYTTGFEYSGEGLIKIEYSFNDTEDYQYACTMLKRWSNAYNKYEKFVNRKRSVISIVIKADKLPLLKFLNITK